MRILNAEALIESFSEASATNYYTFIGRVNAWTPDDNAPPTPTDDVQSVSYDHWRDMIAAKRIQSTDISHVVPRNNWTTGTVYTAYSDTNQTLFSDPFYVMNNINDVYKCLFNNAGAASTIQPTGQGTTVITTADGYKWKYLYTIGAADGLKWLTENYMPVKFVDGQGGDDSSDQWDVASTAVDGAIDIVLRNAGGSSYTAIHTGVLASVTNSTVVELASGADGSFSNIYANSAIYITGGTGQGQLKTINASNTLKHITVSSAFTTVPDGTSTYSIAPDVVFTGDGAGATAVLTVTGGSVNSTVTVLTSGTGYTNCIATVTANASYGSGATLTPIIGPKGGHGSDPVEELGGYYAMINTRLQYGEANTFTTDNDFRKIGIMSNPNYANGDLATASLIDQGLTFQISGTSGTFVADEQVTNPGGASATLIDANSTVMRCLNQVGTFANSDVITGGTSSATCTADIVTGGEFQSFSGEILYIEQRKPITRSSDQIEDIKIIIQF